MGPFGGRAGGRTQSKATLLAPTDLQPKKILAAAADDLLAALIQGPLSAGPNVTTLVTFTQSQPCLRLLNGTASLEGWLGQWY